MSSRVLILSVTCLVIVGAVFFALASPTNSRKEAVAEIDAPTDITLHETSTSEVSVDHVRSAPPDDAPPEARAIVPIPFPLSATTKSVVHEVAQASGMHYQDIASHLVSDALAAELIDSTRPLLAEFALAAESVKREGERIKRLRIEAGEFERLPIFTGEYVEVDGKRLPTMHREPHPEFPGQYIGTEVNFQDGKFMKVVRINPGQDALLDSATVRLESCRSAISQIVHFQIERWSERK